MKTKYEFVQIVDRRDREPVYHGVILGHDKKNTICLCVSDSNDASVIQRKEFPKKEWEVRETTEQRVRTFFQGAVNEAFRKRCNIEFDLKEAGLCIDRASERFRQVFLVDPE